MVASQKVHNKNNVVVKNNTVTTVKNNNNHLNIENKINSEEIETKICDDNSKNLFISTWNVLSLQKNKTINEDRLSRLIEVMELYEIDVMGLCETRLTGNGQIHLENGRVLFYAGYDLRMRGVGLLINKNLHDKLKSVKPVSERIITARFKINKKYLTIVQVYAPTNTTDTEKIHEFYNGLQTEMDEIHPDDVIVVMGDFNAKVGNDNRGFEDTMGRNAVGRLCDNGRTFKDYCLLNDLVIGGSLFEHDEDEKVSWYSNDGKTKNQIDHVVITKKWKRLLKDVKAIKGVDIGSDHRMVVSEIDFKPVNVMEMKKIEYYTFYDIDSEDVNEIWEKLKGDDNIINVDENNNIIDEKRIHDGIIKKSITKCNNDITKNNEISSKKNRKEFDIKRITKQDISESIKPKYKENRNFLYKFFNLIIKTRTIPDDWYRDTNEISTLFLNIIKKKLSKYLIETITIASTPIDYITVLQSILNKFKTHRSTLYMNFMRLPRNGLSSWKHLEEFGISKRLIKIIDFDQIILRSEILSISFHIVTKLNDTGIPWLRKQIEYIQYDENVCLLSDSYDGIQEKTRRVVDGFEIVPEMTVLKLHPDSREAVRVNGNDLVEDDVIVFRDGIVTKRNHNCRYDKKPNVINFNVRKSKVTETLHRYGWDIQEFKRISKDFFRDVVSTMNQIDTKSIKDFYNKCVDKIMNKNNGAVLGYIDDELVETWIRIEKWKWILNVLQMSDDYVVKQVFKWNPNGSSRCKEKLYDSWGTETYKELKGVGMEWNDLKNIDDDEKKRILQKFRERN